MRERNDIGGNSTSPSAAVCIASRNRSGPSRSLRLLEYSMMRCGTDLRRPAGSLRDGIIENVEFQLGQDFSSVLSECRRPNVDAQRRLTKSQWVADHFQITHVWVSNGDHHIAVPDLIV